MSEPLIALRGLTKRYGPRPALDGVDLHVATPQIVGVVGPDGAGKTTLLRALAGLLDVTATEARVLGFDLTGDVTALKAHIGYVPQSFSLHRDLSVIENLRFTARLHRLPDDELTARASTLLERTGLAPFADRAAGALSGGMKQKLAIANALLPRPTLMVLDEPTAGVDVVARAEIWAMLTERRQDTLVVISTSYLDEAAACDTLVYLDGGHVIATGTPAALRARVPLALYRAWGDDARAIASAARALPYVHGARATGRFARIEVRRDGAPDATAVVRDLAALPGDLVQLAEPVPLDMESTLLGLSQGLVVSAPIIRTRGLTRRFGSFTAVNDLSIAVEPGSIYAFLGANGSGKSTTIRMLIGLLAPTAGSIEVDGVDVCRHPRRVRDRIGYMGQKVSLYTGLSLRENVEFYAGLFGLEDAALEERWGALRERFGLAEAEREKPEDLPAGIRQRAGLAVSTLHRPRVLFLDEPTAGVDVRSRGLFWEVIQDEARAGVTVFVTTHFLEEVDYCDHVSFIDAGRLIADATPEELRRRHSDGYRVTIELPPADRATVAATLRGAGAEATSTPDGLALRVPALAPSLLAVLARLTLAGARVHVEQPEMTEVFRRLLARREAA